MATKKKSETKKSSGPAPGTKAVKKRNQLAESKTLDKDAEEVELEEEEGKAEFFRENPWFQKDRSINSASDSGMIPIEKRQWYPGM